MSENEGGWKMKKEIKLSEQYILIINVVYVKNCSTNERKYEIRSKIVNIEDYTLDNDCIGEIEGEYLYKVSVHTPAIFKKYGKNLIEYKIKKAITSIIERSKDLVEEWESKDSVMSNIATYIDEIKSNEN